MIAGLKMVNRRGVLVSKMLTQRASKAKTTSTAADAIFGFARQFGYKA